MADEQRIKVRPNGPYLVSGQVPLREMAPVHTLNGEPVDWHVLKDFETEGNVYALCRCGHSKNRPFCDGAHASENFDGEETADRQPIATRIKTDSGPDGQVLQEGNLCIGAGFCGTRTKNLWDMVKETDDEETRKELIAMANRCPSSSVTFASKDGETVEPNLPQDIAVVPGGPLWVRGGVAVEAADGTEWETMNRVTLCRCGASKNKPYCDGAHSDANFDER
jgi:CDGSH-type Zn-finger protein